MSKQSWYARTAAGRTFLKEVAANPKETLLAFDFDGTLAHIVKRPEDARLVEESASALATLARAGIRIAIISGRPVDTILELADAYNRPGLADAVVFGQYGAERLNMATGERHIPAPPEEVALAKEDLKRAVVGYPGAHVEDKGLAIAAHFREAESPDAIFLQIEDAVRAIATAHNLTVEPGRYVWELRGTTVTKGDAFSSIIADTKAKVIAFAGDDLGDLAAIAVLEKIRGEAGEGIRLPPATCVVISESAEAPELKEKADVLCDGPTGVAQWLQDLADVVEAVGAQQKVQEG